MDKEKQMIEMAENIERVKSFMYCKEHGHSLKPYLVNSKCFVLCEQCGSRYNEVK